MAPVCLYVIRETEKHAMSKTVTGDKAKLQEIRLEKLFSLFGFAGIVLCLTKRLCPAQLNFKLLTTRVARSYNEFECIKFMTRKV